MKMHMSLVVALYCALYKRIINKNVEFSEIPQSSLSNEFNRKCQIILLSVAKVYL